MVPKKDKSWRLCIDFKDLNNAFQKDSFPLPRIDQIIDATAGHDSLCFLDAYSGYHQIKMAEPDQAATAFITPYGPFCFNTMPFGLKNAGATYQRMIQTCLEKQIGKVVEAYMDDVVIKTRHWSPPAALHRRSLPLASRARPGASHCSPLVAG